MKGFTLMELLVVIVIIGILSAVALPQYQRAVEKARATEAVVVTKAIQDAMLRHIQEYPEDESSMTTQAKIADVKLTNGKWIGAASTGASSCFTTKHFAYDISGSYITATRVNDPAGCGSGIPSGSALYTVTLYKTIPDNTIDRMLSCTSSGSKYDYVCPLFKQ